MKRSSPAERPVSERLMLRNQSHLRTRDLYALCQAIEKVARARTGTAWDGATSMHLTLITGSMREVEPNRGRSDAFVHGRPDDWYARPGSHWAEDVVALGFHSLSLLRRKTWVAGQPLSAADHAELVTAIGLVAFSQRDAFGRQRELAAKAVRECLARARVTASTFPVHVRPGRASGLMPAAFLRQSAAERDLYRLYGLLRRTLGRIAAHVRVLRRYATQHAEAPRVGRLLDRLQSGVDAAAWLFDGSDVPVGRPTAARMMVLGAPLPRTSGGRFVLLNRSHYDTTDILAVMECVERAVLSVSPARQVRAATDDAPRLVILREGRVRIHPEDPDVGEELVDAVGSRWAFVGVPRGHVHTVQRPDGLPTSPVERLLLGRPVLVPGRSVQALALAFLTVLSERDRAADGVVSRSAAEGVRARVLEETADVPIRVRPHRGVPFATPRPVDPWRRASYAFERDAGRLRNYEARVRSARRRMQRTGLTVDASGLWIQRAPELQTRIGALLHALEGLRVVLDPKPVPRPGTRPAPSPYRTPYLEHVARLGAIGAGAVQAATQRLQAGEESPGDVEVVRDLGWSLRAWSARLARALAIHHPYMTAEDREEMVQSALGRVWRAALGQPDVPFAKAAPATALRSAGGFRWLASRQAHEWRRGMERRGLRPWVREGENDADAVPDVEQLPDTAGGRRQESSGAYREAPVSEAPRADGTRERPWRLRRRSALWQGDLGVWAATHELVAAFRALAPFWLGVRVGGTVRAAGRVGIRTIAALQTPNATTRAASAALPRIPGVPIADLDDACIAEAAWARLGQEERGAAERARARARAALAEALTNASLPQVEAWQHAVSCERRLAEEDAPDAALFGEVEAAWVELYGSAELRGDSAAAAEALRGQRGMRELESALLGLVLRRRAGTGVRPGLEGAAEGSAAPARTWDVMELRALLAWCEAWARSLGLGRGLRHRRPEDLRAALAERIAAVEGGSLDALGPMAMLAGMAARVLPVHPQVFAEVLDAARAAVARAGGGEAVWARVRDLRPAAVGAPDPVAVVLDADERLAAAAWLGVPHADEVLAGVGARMAGWNDARRRRAARALALTHARFPTAGAADELIALLTEPSALPAAMAALLGAPVLADPASVAFADDTDTSTLARVGVEGDAADVWVGGGRLVLVGGGWSVPGLILQAEDVGTRGEQHRALLPPGTWRVLRHGRTTLTLAVRMKA